MGGACGSVPVSLLVMVSWFLAVTLLVATLSQFSSVGLRWMISLTPIEW